MFKCPNCQWTVFLPHCSQCGFAPADRKTEELTFTRTATEITPDDIADITRKKVVVRVRIYRIPKPFKTRLASFLGMNESEVMNANSRQSKMALRMLPQIGKYFAGKTPELICQILIRISKLVKQKSN